MLTDSFFQQGATHQICEDYALNGDDYVVVSDGCSNGEGPSIFSDWGSRLITLAAARCIKDLKTEEHLFIDNVGKLVLEQVEQLKLNQICLSATLLAMTPVDEKQIYAIVVGDGVVGGRRKDGTWQITSIEFVPPEGKTGSAPFYPIYYWANESQKFADNWGKMVCKTTYNGTFEKMEVMINETDMSLNEPWFGKFFSREEFDFVFVGTDGLNTFTQLIVEDLAKKTIPITLTEALQAMFNGLPDKGLFLKRQANWAFKQNKFDTFIRRGWTHSDDISIGGIMT